VRSHIFSLFKNVRMCDRTFFCSLRKCKKVWSHNRSFEISECVKICKKSAKSHFFAHSPFLKEQLAIFLKCEKSTSSKFALFCTFAHFRSLKMCDCAIAHFFALSKRANVRKLCEFPNRTFFAQKKSDRTFSNCAIAQPWTNTMFMSYLPQLKAAV